MALSLFDGTTEQFRKFVAVNASYSLKPLHPALDELTQDLLPRFIGQDTTDLILEKAGVTLNVDTQRPFIRALALARSAIAKLGFSANSIFAEVQIDDDGITVAASDGRKAAFEYQTNKLQKQLDQTGWRDLDNLIQLISKNPDFFPDWQFAPYYKEHTEGLFTSAYQFSMYYTISDSWLTFWALRPYIREVEADKVETARSMMTGLPNDTSESALAKINDWLLRHIAYQSVVEALPNLSIEIAGASVQVNFASQYGNAKYFTPPSREQLDWAISRLQEKANQSWSRFSDAVATAIGIPDTTSEDQSTGLFPQDGSVVMF